MERARRPVARAYRRPSAPPQQEAFEIKQENDFLAAFTPEQVSTAQAALKNNGHPMDLRSIARHGNAYLAGSLALHGLMLAEAR